MSKNPTRIEQLGALMTAMVAVIVSGSSDLLISDPVPNPSTQYLNLPVDILRKVTSPCAGPYYGMASQIAREVGVHRSVVNEVLHGRSKSDRVVPVVLARICEIEQIEDPSAITSPRPQKLEVFSLKDLEQFKYGGRYYGICARVGCSLGVSGSNVSHVVHGRKINKRALDAVRAEMDRVDAEIAAKGGSK